FTWDEAGRLAETERPFSSVSGEFSYDGRGFLSHGSGDGYDIVDFVDPVYTSEGLLVLRNRTQFEHFQEDYVLYFGQRPVALFQRVLSSLAGKAADPNAPPTSSGPTARITDCEAGEDCTDQKPGLHENGSTEATDALRPPVPPYEYDLLWLTTDHLGTPILATNDAGAVRWSGGFEPFGADHQEGTFFSASIAGVFLRLPGQWEDPVW